MARNSWFVANGDDRAITDRFNPSNRPHDSPEDIDRPSFRTLRAHKAVRTILTPGLHGFLWRSQHETAHNRLSSRRCCPRRSSAVTRVGARAQRSRGPGEMDRSTQRVVGVAALVTFAGLPGLGVVCGLMCVPPLGSTGTPTVAAAAHMSHGSNTTLSETSNHSQLHVGAKSTHACGDHATIIREWTAKLTRSQADHQALLAVAARAQDQATASAQVASYSGAADASPPDPSGTRIPLVLRI